MRPAVTEDADARNRQPPPLIDLEREPDLLAHHRRFRLDPRQEISVRFVERIDALDRTKQSFLDAVALGAFTVPGDGSLDFGQIFKRFADYGYEGWFVVEAEQDPKKNPPLKMAQVGYKELMKDMTAAGYTVETQGFPAK